MNRSWHQAGDRSQKKDREKAPLTRPSIRRLTETPSPLEGERAGVRGTWATLFRPSQGCAAWPREEFLTELVEQFR